MKPNKLKETEIGYIPDDWDMTTLDEISLKVTDGSHFSPKECNDSENIICTVKDMGYHKFSFEKAKKISDKDFDELFKNGCSPEKGDILISKDGANCLDLMFVYEQDKHIVLLSSIAIVRLKQNFNPFFYRYYLLSPQVQKLMRNGYISGSAIPRVVLKDFKKLPVPLVNNPSEEEKIANIFKSIDYKIQINQKMNQTLEEIGKTIFKHWFVYFEFPDEDGKTYKSSGGEMVDSELGMIPKGWEVSKIGNTLKTVLGGTPSRKNDSYWTDGIINWINSGEVNKFRITEPTELITEEALKKSATKLLPKGTTVLAITGATLGQISRLEIDSCANQSVVGVLGSDRIPSEYSYFWMKHIIKDIMAWQSGGAHQHINKQNINDSKILIPEKRVLELYINILIPIFDKISSSCFEISSLSQIRDSLIPKLMSGKIRVPLEEK